MNEETGEFDVMKTWKDLFQEITWDWDGQYEITRHNDGIFTINKLSITPTEADYKTSRWKISPHLYKYVEMLYAIQEMAKEEERALYGSSD